MSDRQQGNLRGPVMACTEEYSHPGVTGPDGKVYPGSHSVHITDYDPDGRILATRSHNSEGSQWSVRYDYDASGRLRMTASGNEGKTSTTTTYSYDQQGRLQSISPGDRPGSPLSFRYDEQGRKTKIAISRADDFRPNVAVAGSPFGAADRAPNLPGGGSATTLHDEFDRPTEVQVRNAAGDLVGRTLRTYDTQGNVTEEKQVLDNLAMMVPPEVVGRMLEESGLSADQLQSELRTQLSKVIRHPSEPNAVSYRYDAHGRVNLTRRRILNWEDEIETTYNDHGDIESEITRSTRFDVATDTTSPTAVASYSEVRYGYGYDQQKNWTEKTTSYRPTPDGTFQPSTFVKRTLTYYESSSDFGRSSTLA